MQDRLVPSQHVAIAVAVILALGLGAVGAAAGGALVAAITIVPVVREIGTLSILESQGFLLVVTGAVLVVGAVIESEHTTVLAKGRSEARLRTTFEDAPIGMAITDVTPGRSGRWLEVNAALTRTLGRSADELLRTDPTSLIHPDDQRRAAGVAELIAAHQVISTANFAFGIPTGTTSGAGTSSRWYSTRLLVRSPMP